MKNALMTPAAICRVDDRLELPRLSTIPIDVRVSSTGEDPSNPTLAIGDGAGHVFVNARTLARILHWAGGGAIDVREET